MQSQIKGFIDQALSMGQLAAFGIPGPQGIGVAVAISAVQLGFDILAGQGNPMPALATADQLAGVEGAVLKAIADTSFNTQLETCTANLTSDNDTLVEAVKLISLKSTDDDKDTKAQQSWDTYQATNLTKYYGTASPVLVDLKTLVDISDTHPKDYATLGLYTLGATIHIGFCKFAMAMEWNKAVDAYRADCATVDRDNVTLGSAHIIWAQAKAAGQTNLGPEPVLKNYPDEPEPSATLPGGPAYVSIQTKLPDFITYVGGVAGLYRKAFDQRAQRWATRLGHIVVEKNGAQSRWVDQITGLKSRYLDPDDFNDSFDAHVGQLYDEIVNTAQPERVGGDDVPLSLVKDDELKKFETLLAAWTSDLKDYA